MKRVEIVTSTLNMAKTVWGIPLQGLRRFLCDDRGATSIEYGLMAALIGLMVVTGATALGGSINQQFNDVALLISGPPEPPTSNSDTGP